MSPRPRGWVVSFFSPIAIGTLGTVSETDEPRVLPMALGHVAQARGIARVAKAAGVERESLYRALSANGNPRLSTLYAVAKAVGLKLTLDAA